MSCPESSSVVIRRTNFGTPMQSDHGGEDSKAIGSLVSGSGRRLRVKLRPGRDGHRFSSSPLSSSPDVVAAECSVDCDLEVGFEYQKPVLDHLVMAILAYLG
ncbi:hypothetical protein Fot_22662 [Forsythia ovata]|uniref:Uncharacterized protein n=1 Tax=Forsythia ovata TaxID=205694 RepID=A0ABD1UYQ8_9LAMI